MLMFLILDTILQIIPYSSLRLSFCVVTRSESILFVPFCLYNHTPLAIIYFPYC
ncbi:hypothetical protein BGZ60DRAFT_414511 [Tricladium varicosporioides]|nr:hypothetical protein BGZ60DRAFT_414511 [Hymenoscyphus varicosporioides]